MIGRIRNEEKTQIYFTHGFMSLPYWRSYRLCGAAFEVDHVKKEFGDLLWFIAEYCTAKGWSLDDIMRMNIDKLKERYPDGFKAEQSLHRKAGDI